MIVTVPKLFFPSTELICSQLFTTDNITAINHKIGLVVHAPKTGNITRVRYLVSTASSAPNIDVRLETVASGKPSGTLWGSNTNVTVPHSLSGNAPYEATLASSAAVNHGDLIAIVFRMTATGAFAIHAHAAENFTNLQFPGLYQDTTGSYAVRASRSPLVALRYSDNTYESPLGCFWSSSVAATGAYSVGEQGVRFRLPYTARVCGIWHTCDPDGSVTFKLYEDSAAPGGASLLSKTQAPAEFESANVFTPSYCMFNGKQTLSANTWYRLAVAVSGGPTRFTYCDVPTAAEMNASMGGSDFYATASSGGSWVDTVTRQPQIGLVIDGLDDGSGSSSASPFSFAN